MFNLEWGGKSLLFKRTPSQFYVEHHAQNPSKRFFLVGPEVILHQCLLKESPGVFFETETAFLIVALSLGECLLSFGPVVRHSDMLSPVT